MKLSKIRETLVTAKLPDDASEEAIELAFAELVQAVSVDDSVWRQLTLLDTYPDWRNRLLGVYLKMNPQYSTYLHKIMRTLSKAPACSSPLGVVL